MKALGLTPNASLARKGSAFTAYGFVFLGTMRHGPWGIVSFFWIRLRACLYICHFAAPPFSLKCSSWTSQGPGVLDLQTYRLPKSALPFRFEPCIGYMRCPWPQICAFLTDASSSRRTMVEARKMSLRIVMAFRYGSHP